MSDVNKTVVVAKAADEAMACVVGLVKAIKAGKSPAAIFVEEFPLLTKALSDVGQLGPDAQHDLPGTLNAVFANAGDLVAVLLTTAVVPVSAPVPATA